MHAMINGIDRRALLTTQNAVKDNPALAHLSFTLGSNWLSGCHQRAQTGELRQNGAVVAGRKTRYILESDEPAVLRVARNRPGCQPSGVRAAGVGRLLRSHFCDEHPRCGEFNCRPSDWSWRSILTCVAF